MLRSAALNSIGVAAIMYLGAIVISCIKLGSINNMPLVATNAFPWFYGSLAILLVGFSLYMVVLLCIAKLRLKGTGLKLMEFMALPLEERHALMKSFRRGPYRDA